MDKKRGRIFLILVFVIALALAGRLFYIQILGFDELSAAAAVQQQVTIIGLDRRGTIYDRNMTPLTGGSTEYVYLTHKSHIDSEFYEIMDGLGARGRGSASSEYAVYASDTYDKDTADLLAEKYLTYIIEASKRYDEAQTAAHVIGYVNTYDNKGISGIEYELNDILSAPRGKIYAVADRDGAFLPGMPLREENADGESGASGNIVLTLDSKIQEIAENALSESDKNGAVVILDAKTGEILAIASTPVYNPNSVKDYIESGDNELVNKCTQGEYPPGSIFKIVVTAAALENETRDKDGRLVDKNTMFHCTGKEKLSGIEIGCSTGGKDGHGDISLEQAFAYSCNCAFIQLGKLTGSENIIDMAEKLGLGEAPISDLPSVRRGNVTTLENAVGDGIGNLSIGQGEMLVTPLQVARLTNIIARRGNDVELSLIKNADEIMTSAGGSFAQRRVDANVISKETAEEITHMMRQTVIYGTARGTGSNFEAAGKTGSAETGTYEGAPVHGWFTGFFPASDPKYTITVFVENGRSGRASAVPIFEKIAAEIESL